MSGADVEPGLTVTSPHLTSSPHGTHSSMQVAYRIVDESVGPGGVAARLAARQGQTAGKGMSSQHARASQAHDTERNCAGLVAVRT